MKLLRWAVVRRPDLQPDPAASAAFLAQVRADAPTPRIHALGGSGILLRYRSACIVIDPYLLNTLGDRDPGAPPGWRDRNLPPPTAPGDLSGLSAIVITHGHGDHFDGPTLRALQAANPGVTLVLPHVLKEEALELGFSPGQLQHPVNLRRHDLQDAVLLAIPAAHTPPEQPQPHPDDAGGHHEVGYLLELGPLKLYHAGDTVVYPELLELLKDRVDVAVLPINGRRWSPLQPLRLGNMTAEEAADLAGLAGIRTVIPVHHVLLGSSAGGLETLMHYVAERWPDITVALLGPGDVWPARGLPQEWD
ncbi:MBL fold metallo-hydrolase [Deinococcus marmoris]|uniref:MBL fold metallo-hydrolase n=1 Tax=Deinococcus marmoris TaxID=249408 RepID=UPI00096AB7DC|nr:MBL fold metallo-hydrolase [Deinococcus marmoris]